MLLEARRISKQYRSDSTAVTALHPTSLRIDNGEFVAILGPSGSGKSTLMSILGLLDRPSSGEFFIDGRDSATLSDDQAAGLRNRLIGFVFQSYHLLPRQSILHNVELPLLYSGVGRAERRERATQALTAVKLPHRIDHLPSQLSGGEQQRAAIARAIVTKPAIILADEPTGALDSATGWEILQLLIALNRVGRTIVLVTHDVDIAHQASRIISIRDGTIVSDQSATAARAAATAAETMEQCDAAA